MWRRPPDRDRVEKRPRSTAATTATEQTPHIDPDGHQGPAAPSTRASCQRARSQIAGSQIAGSQIAGSQIGGPDRSSQIGRRRWPHSPAPTELAWTTRAASRQRRHRSPASETRVRRTKVEDADPSGPPAPTAADGPTPLSRRKSHKRPLRPRSDLPCCSHRGGTGQSDHGQRVRT